MNRISRWACGESGATSVEYALVTGLIAVVIVAAVQALGANLIPIFTNASAAFGS